MEANTQTNTDAGLQERLRSAGSDARESVSNLTEASRARTGNMQAQFADFLDNAAESLRKQSESMRPADSGPDFGGALSAVAPQIASSEAAVAGVLAGSASWLRENDLSDIEVRITEQVQEHPVRTLAIAAAVGFLISRK